MIVNHTILAFLLALKDFSTHLSVTEKQNLQDVGKQLRYQPRAWQTDIEPLLLQTVQANNQLNNSYQFYKDKLNKFETVPPELLPTNQQINDLLTENSGLIEKGFDSDSLPTGYEQQLNNVMILVSQADNPEELVKKLSFLGKLKQLLTQSSQ